jgi:hypothetical protein
MFWFFLFKPQKPRRRFTQNGGIGPGQFVWRRYTTTCVVPSAFVSFLSEICEKSLIFTAETLTGTLFALKRANLR